MTSGEKKEYIKELSLAFAPCGFEDEVAEIIKNRLEKNADEVTIDRCGNVTALIKGTGSGEKKRLMLLCGMDEVGFMINGIDENGMLRFENVGKIAPYYVCGRNVTVGNEKYRQKGVTASKAIHHQTREEREKVTPSDKLYIDIGAKDYDETVKYFSIGDYAVFDSDFLTLGKDGGYMKGKALGVRCNCAILSEVAENLSREKPENDIYLCFVTRTQSRFPTSFAQAERIAPDAAISLSLTEVGCGGDGVMVGDGFIVSLSDGGGAYCEELCRSLASSDKKAKIVSRSSNDISAHALQAVKKGIACASVSLPVKNIGSPSEVVSGDDIEDITKALTAFAKKF